MTIHCCCGLLLIYLHRFLLFFFITIS